MSTPTGGTQDPNQGWQQDPPPPPPQDGAFGGGTGGTSPAYGAPPSYGQAAGTPQLAGFWIRFAGAFIDGIILSIIAFIIGLVIGLDVNGRNSLTTLLGAVYFTYLHGTTGQSLGQKVVSIKLVDESTGGGIDFVRAFIRWLVSIVSGIVILLGYLWMLWDPKNQTWHDKAARTLVVKT